MQLLGKQEGDPDCKNQFSNVLLWEVNLAWYKLEEIDRISNTQT